MRFYSNDAEAERESGKRASHPLLLAEWRDGGGSAAPLIRNSVSPTWRGFAEELAARAGLVAPNMRGTAQDAVRQLRAFAADHAAKADTPYIADADREGWRQSAEVLRALADAAQGRLDARAA
jgi:hypothetical protein